MICPKCLERMGVFSVKIEDDYIHRERVCHNCGRKRRTVEQWEDDVPEEMRWEAIKSNRREVVKQAAADKIAELALNQRFIDAVKDGVILRDLRDRWHEYKSYMIEDARRAVMRAERINDPHRRFTDEEDAFIKKHYRAETKPWIAKKLNRSANSVIGRARRKKLRG